MPTKAVSESLSDYWRTQVNAWSKSGQCQQAFCRQHELSYHRFTYWRRKFHEQSQLPKHRAISALVPVTPIDSENLLSLHLPSGVALRGITSSNLGVVQQLLSCLS